MRVYNITLGLLGVLVALNAHAAPSTTEIRMMTMGPNNTSLVFDPMFVKVNVGDTVTFKPLQKAGHTSISLYVPDGAKPWVGKPDTELSVKMDKPGVYLVECNLHKMMGMVAVVQVGKATNLDEAKKKAAEESAKMVMNKDRYAKLLAQVK